MGGIRSTGQRLTTELSPLSITHNLLHITEQKYLHSLITIKPPSETCYSDHMCLSLPPVSTRLKFADRSFRNSSPRLWNSLPKNLRSFAPDTHHFTTDISSTPSYPCNAVSLSLAISFFHALKPTSSHFRALHNLSALPSSLLLSNRPVLTSTNDGLTPTST